MLDENQNKHYMNWIVIALLDFVTISSYFLDLSFILLCYSLCFNCYSVGINF